MIRELDHGLMGCSVLAFFARAIPNLFPLKKYKDASVHRWALMALLFSSAREHYAFGGTLDDDSLLICNDFNSCFLSELEVANT